MVNTSTSTTNPDRAGTAPIDPSNLAPAGGAADTAHAPGAAPEPPPTRPQDEAAGPIGGEATTAATSWTGAPDEELEDDT